MTAASFLSLDYDHGPYGDDFQAFLDEENVCYCFCHDSDDRNRRILLSELGAFLSSFHG